MQLPFLNHRATQREQATGQVFAMTSFKENHSDASFQKQNLFHDDH